MSTFEINKIVGAVLAVLLVSTAIDMIGDALVPLEPNKAGSRTVAATAPEAPTAKAPEAPTAKAPSAKAAKPASLAKLLASADAAAGRKIARKCSACHSLTKSGKNKIGPNLWDIVGAAKARNAGFNYSKAMRAKGGKWGYEALNAFLANPRAYIKGNKMTFAGVKKPRGRADLIAYLRSLSASPAPLP
jgi:cytochrome c